MKFLNHHMMRKLPLLFLFFLFLPIMAKSQEMMMAQKMNLNLLENEPKSSAKFTFEFMSPSRMEELNHVSVEEAGEHFLGSDIAKKVYYLNGLYSYKEPVAPGSSATKTMFRKPVIYSSVKKIERHLRKQVKAGGISLEIARYKYNKVLDVALSIVKLNTNNFEYRIKSAGSVDELLNIYITEVRLESIN